MSDALRLVTAEQLFKYPESKRYDLVRGEPQVREPPGGLHGRLAARLATRLGHHVEQHGLGTVLVEAGYVLRTAPDTVRGPDVSFISGARMPPDQIPERFIPGAPDLAVEVLSPGSRWPEVEEVLADYFASGARVVWVVVPRQRRIVVRYPDRPPEILAGNDFLDGGEVVPGFYLGLVDLFGV